MGWMQIFRANLLCCVARQSRWRGGAPIRRAGESQKEVRDHSIVACSSPIVDPPGLFPGLDFPISSLNHGHDLALLQFPCKFLHSFLNRSGGAQCLHSCQFGGPAKKANGVVCSPDASDCIRIGEFLRCPQTLPPERLQMGHRQKNFPKIVIRRRPVLHDLYD